MSERFQINIEPEVLDDLQNAIDYYDSKKEGLGEIFLGMIDKHFELLKDHYLSFAVRYDDIRCLPVKKFPYTIHYRVLSSQKIVSIKAVFCSFEDPDKWEERAL
jgi:hypothetical protein